MRQIHALLPRLSSQVGHIFHYHIAVEKALKLIGWFYRAYIPIGASIAPLPFGWEASLANDVLEKPKNFLQKMQIFFANVLPFRKIFRTIEKRKDAVVFIEHFEFHHLLSIATALVFLKPQFQFWLLHRYELEGRRLKSLLHRIFLQFLYKKLGRRNVWCLTDSDLLAESLAKDLCCFVSTLPIPHTEVKLKDKIKQKELTFWWPGGLIREDKGLSKIQQILGLLKGDMRIIAAEKAKDVFGDHPKIQFVPTSLSREDYMGLMHAADLILLPYSESAYSRRTSGVFVEAISYGAVPVTTKGTWMAYELHRFALDGLTFDWSEPNLIEMLSGVASDPVIREKLDAMQLYYRDFHSISGFANALQKLQD